MSVYGRGGGGWHRPIDATYPQIVSNLFTPGILIKNIALKKRFKKQRIVIGTFIL